MRKKNIFILGLDDFNLQMLNKLPGADQYNFIGLIDIHKMISSGRYYLEDMLNLAQHELDNFKEPIDAIVGYTDFPVSTMVPILCERYGVPGPSLESVIKCEHKYWSRLEQYKSVPEYIPDFHKFNPFADDPLAEIPLQFPFWVKPVKSTASQLGFRINNKKDFQDAIEVIRRKIGQFRPFDFLMNSLQLPEEIADVNSSFCVAEQIIGGRQCTLEGYAHNGKIRTYGIVDSIRDANRTTFSRYQYPSSLPKNVQKKMAEITEKTISYAGFDNSAFNVEFYWNEKDNKIWLLEINTRIPQSHSDLFDKVDGFSNHYYMIKAALGEDPGLPKGKGEFNIAGKFFLREYKDKLITAVPSREDLVNLNYNLPGTLVDFQGQAGMKLSEIPEQDSYSYAIAFIYLGAENQKALREKYKEVIKSMKIEYRDI